jgi:type IV secretion system protein VirB9
VRNPATQTSLLLALLYHAVAHADAIPAEGLTDPRITFATYHEDEVYRITGRIGYQIDLTFAPDERFVGLAAGDVQALTFEAQDNHLFLKPRAARVATNVTVLTNRRHYHFDYTVPGKRLSAEPGSAPLAAPIYALRFAYPEDAAHAAAERARQEASAASNQKMGSELSEFTVPKNTNYWYCGPRAIRPTTVVDDGVQTRLTFGARTELPAIFTRAADGTESLVNFTVNEAGMTVHRIAAQFILRRGRLVGCVVNKSFDGAGERLPTGTVSPEVERTIPHAPDAPKPQTAVRDAQ